MASKFKVFRCKHDTLTEKLQILGGDAMYAVQTLRFDWCGHSHPLGAERLVPPWVQNYILCGKALLSGKKMA